MPAFSRRHLLMGSLALAATPLHAQDKSARTLVFALITPRAAQQTRDNWWPFIERLGHAVRMPVELRTFADQAELVESFRRGEVDLGWMGNGPALAVVESGAGAVFAQMVTKEGRFGFNSILIVPRDSPHRNLSDVLARAKTLRFADGDPKSASGHMVPSYFAFQKNGVENTRAVFKSVINGNHQKNLTMVAKGEIDVATANNEELVFFGRDFPELAKQVRVVWESPLIPQSPLVWKSALPLDLRRKILQFTTTFGGTNAEERRILDKVNSLSGFRQSSNRQLVTIADLEMFKARQAINNDRSLSNDERTRRIEATIRRGSRLDLLLKLSASVI